MRLVLRVLTEPAAAGLTYFGWISLLGALCLILCDFSMSRLTDGLRTALLVGPRPLSKVELRLLKQSRGAAGHPAAYWPGGGGQNRAVNACGSDGGGPR